MNTPDSDSTIATFGEPRRYRKKPVVIDAIRFDGSEESIEAIRAFAKGAGLAVLRPSWKHADSPDVRMVEIPTLEGTMLAKSGDWIIRGIKGEFYPCKPDIFEATYEQV